MKALVIGGAGYIGSHVVRAMLDDSCEITVYDNLSSGLRENLFPEAVFVEGDILDPEALAAVMQGGFEAVVHLAAFKAAGESMDFPEKYSVNNITGTLNILNAMTAAKIRYFVFSSSAAVYGSPKFLPLDEFHPLDPENYYGFTKLEIERFLSWYSRLKGIRFAALRYFNAAGYDMDQRVKGLEQNPANLLPIVMEAATGKREKLTIFGDDYPTPDGTCIRDYIHVSDLAAGHISALNYLREKDEDLTVNLATGNGSSVLEVYHMACDITGQKIPMEIGPRRPGDPAILYAVANEAREKIGFEPRYSDIETIIRSMYNVYSMQKD